MAAASAVDRGRRADAIVTPSPAERLRDLARRVRRMGLNGRLDPEAAYIERDEIANDLTSVAQVLQRQFRPDEQRQLRPNKPAMPPRTVALLASQRQRIAVLEAQLAQAIRSRPRRRQRPSNDQLSLPLPEEPDGPSQ
jgi:hypothetical protein